MRFYQKQDRSKDRSCLYKAGGLPRRELRRLSEGQAHDLPPARRACGFSTLLYFMPPHCSREQAKSVKNCSQKILTFLFDRFKIVIADNLMKSRIFR
jgi:hypothetical protein